MQRKIALVTDSTCDLPRNIARDYGIHIIPQPITWDGRIYHDGVDLMPVEFYRQLGETSALPTSAAPSPEDFAGAFEAARSVDDADQVVALLLSSKLSDSVQNAQVGAQQVNFPVFIQDTQTVSMGLGFVALAAARARDQGAAVEEILNTARQTRRKTTVFFTVSTLDFLHRGGRIGGARHLIGNALSLKPILTVDDGQVAVAATIRSRSRALGRMLELAGEGVKSGEVWAAVVNGDAELEAMEVLNTISEQWKPEQLIASSVCPSIGTNTGPGVLGVIVCHCTRDLE